MSEPLDSASIAPVSSTPHNVLRANVRTQLPTPSEGARIWFENTKSGHEHGGSGWEFGVCLWSPSKNRGGKDWYRVMREVRKGDLILHSCDGDFHCVSHAKGACQERSDEPPKPAEWA